MGVSGSLAARKVLLPFVMVPCSFSVAVFYGTRKAEEEKIVCGTERYYLLDLLLYRLVQSGKLAEVCCLAGSDERPGEQSVYREKKGSGAMLICREMYRPAFAMLGALAWQATGALIKDLFLVVCSSEGGPHGRIFLFI